MGADFQPQHGNLRGIAYTLIGYICAVIAKTAHLPIYANWYW